MCHILYREQSSVIFLQSVLIRISHLCHLARISWADYPVTVLNYNIWCPDTLKTWLDCHQLIVLDTTDWYHWYFIQYPLHTQQTIPGIILILNTSQPQYLCCKAICNYSQKYYEGCRKPWLMYWPTVLDHWAGGLHWGYCLGNFSSDHSVARFSL